MATFKLNNKGYEPFLDYLKGVCIILVILNHSTIDVAIHNTLLYPLWVYTAVPIFLIIQTYHVYKHDEPNYPRPNKLYSRILKPFILIQLLLVPLNVVKKSYLQDYSIVDAFKSIIASGGVGPGSYYIWIYLQFAFLIPLLYTFARSKYSFIIFIGLSLLYEVLLNYIQVPGYIYRLCSVRYLFLILLGYKWVTNGIVLKKKTFLLSVISAFLLLYNRYVGIDFKPFVYDDKWLSDHWFMYFYCWSLFAFVIYWIYNRTANSLVTKFISAVGVKSYELFLFQMLVFCVPVINKMGGGKFYNMLSSTSLLLQNRCVKINKDTF